MILMLANFVGDLAILLVIAVYLSKIHTEQRDFTKQQSRLNELIIKRMGSRQSNIGNVTTKSPPLDYKPTDRRKRG